MNSFSNKTYRVKTADLHHSLLALASILLMAGSALAEHHGLSSDLEGMDPHSMVNVIVRFSHSPTVGDLENIQAQGGVNNNRLDVVNGVTTTVRAGALKHLALHKNIESISLDRPLKGLLDYAASAVNAGIALQYGFDGTGVGIALIDSGITDTGDFESTKGSRIVYRQSFIGTDTTDAYGHGTHVAGITAGGGNKSTGHDFARTFRGIAPNANLISLRVLDAAGNGTDSAVIAAIQRAIELKDTYNIRVMNLSLGRPVVESYTIDPLCQAVEAAWKAGIVVVVAAGNEGRNNSVASDGYGTITAPGNDPYVITVGAMKTMSTPIRTDDLIASYSSKGPTLIDHVVKPDLVAPGNRIISAEAKSSQLDHTYPQNVVPVSYYKKNGDHHASHDYFRLSGTSMAAPMVSGAAALMLQKQPTLTPDQVKARLMKSASKSFPAQSIATDPITGVSYTSQYDIFTIGAGYLDVWAALNNTDLAGESAVSPMVSFDASSGNVYLTGTHAVWGTSEAWGISAVWGTNAVSGTNAVWGTHAVWGTNTTQGFHAVWGTHAIWGTASFDNPENVAVNGEN